MSDSAAAGTRRRLWPRTGLGKLQLVALSSLILAILAALIALNAAGQNESVTPAVATVGKPAPGFVTTDLHGHRVDLAQFRGKPLVVNFWATWCPACAAEMPDLQRAWQAHRAQHLAVLGIDYREFDRHAIAAYLASHHLSFPVALDEGGTIGAAYDVNIGLPVTVFVNRHGVVTDVVTGQLSPSIIEEDIHRALA